MEEEGEQKQRQQHPEEHNLEMADTTFSPTSDLCQQLLDRYAKSAASQHRHLCAAAAAARSMLQAESLPFTPPAYFAAAISAASETALDPTSASALSSFLSIVLSLVPPGSIPSEKAADAISILVAVVRRPDGGDTASGSIARAVVKCLGLLVGFCDLEDWGSVKLGFETQVSFSLDRRPKVRKCAQVSVQKIFKSFQSFTVIRKASKFVLSLLKSYIPLAVSLETSGTVDGSKPEHLEVLHMLNVVKLIVPYLSVKVSGKMLSKLHKLMSSHFSALTRHILNLIDAFFATSRTEVITSEAECIIISLASYVSLGENPTDTIISAATLLKSALSILHDGVLSTWSQNLSLVFVSIAGLLTSEASTASHASNILKELINDHVDPRKVLAPQDQPFGYAEAEVSMESSAIKSLCAVFESLLNSDSGIPNEHILAVLSVLFFKLGANSSFFMKKILLKLADLMVLASGNMFGTSHLQECIGSAVIAMGPEKILTFVPISFNVVDRTCSNVWLVPILKKYVVGASLGYFMEHIVPLAESIQQASGTVKSSEGKHLKIHARDLWGLLPAFCCRAIDIYQNFGPLAKFFIASLKDNSSMHETISISLQELVKQNRSPVKSNQGAGESNIHGESDYNMEFEKVSSYSKEAATRNIRAIASFSTELLQALIDVLFDSPPEKRSYLKDAIGCLASITDSSITKKILISLLERCRLTDAVGRLKKLEHHTHVADRGEGNSSMEKDAMRSVILELAYSFVGGANEDLIELIYNLVTHTFQGTDEVGHNEAYHTLGRILEEHPWFCSSRFVELMDLVLSLKSPVDITLLKSRFASFHFLLIHSLQRSLEEENAKTFLVLNEIILALKDSREEVRKAAYDTLFMISSSLRKCSFVGSETPHNKLISMIMGYLSGSSPHIKSGAVSALSLLVYQDANICLSVPDLVPSVSALLQSKTVEVIKAVLGFMKVLVSCLQAKDLQNFLPDVASGVFSWSSVSRNHFRSKVTVILEIVIRKCGSAAVEFVTPEKYKGFVKTVMQNRHGKLSSKDAGTADVELKSMEFSPKRQWKKRTHKELGVSAEKVGSMHPKKMRKDNKHNNITGSTNELHMHPDSGNVVKSRPMKGQSLVVSGKKNRRDFNQKPPAVGKRKMDQMMVSRKRHAGIHRRAATSESRLHKKAGWKQKKPNK